MEDKTALRDFFSTCSSSLAKILLKLSRCTCTCWSENLVVICFLGRRPLFHIIFFLLLRPKGLDETAQMHMHAHADLELCRSDVSWTSFYVSFKYFFFFFFFFWFLVFLLLFFCKSPYFTCVYMLQRPRSNCVGAHLYWAIKHLWYPIPFEIINKQSNLEWRINEVSGLMWLWVFRGCSRWIRVFQRTYLF